MNEVKCYQCQDKDSVEEFFPFCSQKCKDKWGSENYKRVDERGKPKLSLSEMQQRLKEMGKEGKSDDKGNAQGETAFDY